MKIVYLPHFESDASSTMCSTIRSLSTENTVVAGGIFPTYRYRWQLYTSVWNRLFGYGWRAMRDFGRRVDVVVAFSHLVLIPFLLARLVGIRPKLVLVGFIYTGRSSRLLSLLRKMYFRAILTKSWLVITHSSAEVHTYSSLFEQTAGKFVYLPLWTHFAGSFDAGVKQDGPVVSAGRSNRDYDTLLKAAGRITAPIRIICDSFSAEADIPENVQVLRDCHQDAYIKELAGASVVVIPLRAAGESSGQMVLLHSMALGKPIAITRTPETEDYVSDQETAVLLERGSADSIVAQVNRILSDPRFAKRLSDRARDHYLSRHTLDAGLRMLDDTIRRRR
jgi:glycosyltransferase involved in cell wall biosynthesis